MAPFFTNPSAIAQATALRTLLATSVVRLFKDGFVPTVNTTLAELEAQEADYSTYAAVTITAFGAPILSVFGGAQITAPTVQFSLAADPAVGNSIGGYWLETAAGAVFMVNQFDAPVPMTKANDGILITPTVVVPNGQ